MTTDTNSHKRVRARWRLFAVLAAVGFAAVANGVTAPPAEAHDALAEANPAQGQTITTQLEEVTLTFNEAPLSGLQGGIVVQVVGPGGQEATTGTVRIADRTLARSVQMNDRGEYTVTWRTVSADGHPIDGSYTFTYAGPVARTPTAQPSASPSPSATPAATSAADAPNAKKQSATPPIALIIGIAIGVLVIAGGTVWTVSQVRRGRASKS